MKTTALWRRLGISVALCGLLIGFGTGCGSPGYRTNESTSSTLFTLATRVESTGQQLNLALSELGTLVHNPQPDLRPQYDRFAAAVQKLHSLSNQIAQADARLAQRSSVHFATWEKELAAMQNDSIRYSGQQRKLELQSRFDGVRNTCRQLLTALGPVQADLQDVHRFLSSDLTSAGLAAIRPAATRLNEQGQPVQQQVNHLVTELRALAMAVAPQNGPAPEQLK